jgi:integrase
VLPSGNGLTSKRAIIGIADRTLAAVFRKSGVVGAYPHRFRHTLATDILTQGGCIQDVADVLGISAKIAEKHYAKWTRARQHRITTLMSNVNLGDTILAQAKKKRL